MTKTSIGEFLSALRRAKGYTQQEVADILNVSNKTISSWECSASCPDISMLPLLADLYGVTCDELIRGERVQKSESESRSRERLERAVEYRLRRTRGRAKTVSLIAHALTAFAVLFTLILGCVAFQSRLGFFLGLAVLLASEICVVVSNQRSRLAVEQNEIASPALNEFSKYLYSRTLRVSLVNFLAFAFILPHLFPATYLGLTLKTALIAGTIFDLGALLLFCIAYPIILYRKSKREFCSEKEKTSLRDRAKYFGVIFGILCVLTVAGGVGAVYMYTQSTYTQPPAPEVYVFETEEEAVEYFEQISNGTHEYTRISWYPSDSYYVVEVQYNAASVVGYFAGYIATLILLALLWLGGLIVYRRKTSKLCAGGSE